MFTTAAAQTISQEHAQSIMGSAFLGTEAVIAHYGRVYSRNQLKSLEVVPFSEETLKVYKNSHFLFAGSPMSIIDVRRRAPKFPSTFDSYDRAWYNDEIFASRPVDVRWYLMGKEVIAHSTTKAYAQQLSMVPDKEIVPRACELVYGAILYFLSTTERLFQNTYLRCPDVSAEGERVYVGHFDSRGFRINSGTTDNYLRDDLGVTSIRLGPERPVTTE